MEPKEKSSSFFSVFENTLDFLKNSISFSSQPEPDNNTPSKTILKTPLENEKIIFETELSTLKKRVPEIVGTKLGFMVVRYEKEGVYMYI
jgi:hypothetical protein